MVIRAVVFDMDGVLVDSEAVWHAVRRDYVASFGGSWTEANQRDCMGANSAQWSSYIRMTFAAPFDEQRIFHDVVSMLRRRYTEVLPVIPGAQQAVRAFADAGFQLAVASSSPQTLIEFLVARLGLAEVFSVLVSSDAVKRGKPEPDVYLHACDQLGVDPSQAVAVEDSGNGILAAASAGLYVVAVPSRDFPPSPTSLARADLVLDSMYDLDPGILRL